MNEPIDQQLLRDYAERRAEAAFTDLVKRHVDLVYSAAFRLTGEAYSAQDITQGVFLALAQNAARLIQHPVLSGWLHTTTRNLAAKHVRAVVRRQNHEQEAAAMNALISSGPEASWEEIAPHLDAALGALSDPERNIILLRYFERKSAGEIAQLLGVSDQAAQKRVSRAVERLRDFFTKRGITVGASGLVLAITANAVQAAPVGLAVTISAAAIAGTTVTTATIVAATTKAIAMTTLQKTLVTATVAVLAGAGIYEGRQAAQLRQQVQVLQEQVGPQADQIQALQSERADLSNRLASLQAENSRLPGNPNQTELLRLRGEMARARQESDAAKAPVTETMVATRYRNAQDLARQGDPAGALKEFLWCFDEGMTRFPAYSGVRTSFLLSSIAALGKDYPSALTALRERRDRAAQLLINGGNDSSTAMDFSALNRALDEDGNSLALFDQLPADAAGRKTLALLLFDKLVEAQRYGDALAGRTYSQMRLIVELGKVEVPVTSPHAETIQKTQRDSIIKNSLVAIEALAGGGELEHAREFAGQLLQYDDSPNTRAQLHQHLTRAGQPQLLDALPNP